MKELEKFISKEISDSTRELEYWIEKKSGDVDVAFLRGMRVAYIAVENIMKEIAKK